MFLLIYSVNLKINKSILIFCCETPNCVQVQLVSLNYPRDVQGDLTAHEGWTQRHTLVFIKSQNSSELSVDLLTTVAKYRSDQRYEIISWRLSPTQRRPGWSVLSSVLECMRLS